MAKTINVPTRLVNIMDILIYDNKRGETVGYLEILITRLKVI